MNTKFKGYCCEKFDKDFKKIGTMSLFDNLEEMIRKAYKDKKTVYLKIGQNIETTKIEEISFR